MNKTLEKSSYDWFGQLSEQSQRVCDKETVAPNTSKL
jgi:hypothetical protein